MTDFNPYITFDGHCEEALDFYKDCFHGEILFTQYYGESPKHVPEEFHFRSSAVNHACAVNPLAVGPRQHHQSVTTLP